ncbi:MAG: hypothetical protein ACD_70C00131G0008, partial [uncultured bacterium]
MRDTTINICVPLWLFELLGSDGVSNESPLVDQLHWAYQHHASIEKILCAMIRYDDFQQMAQADVYLRIESLINILTIIAHTRSTYSDKKITYLSSKIITEKSMGSFEIRATPLEQPSAIRTTELWLFQMRRTSARVIHALDSIMMVAPSARNLHVKLERADTPLYLLAGAFAAAKVLKISMEIMRYTIGYGNIRDTEKNMSKSDRFRDQAQKNWAPLLRDLIWASLRFLCASDQMKEYREYLTFALFSFSLFLNVFLAYKNYYFYTELKEALENNRSDTFQITDENPSINDDKNLTSEQSVASHIRTHLNAAFFAAQKEMFRKEHIPNIVIWGSYAVGASFCITDER